MAGPWDKYRTAPGPVTIGTPDPYKARENSRQDTELVIRQQNADRLAAAEERMARAAETQAAKTAVETEILRARAADPIAKERALLKLKAQQKNEEILRGKRLAARQITAQLDPIMKEYDANFRGGAGMASGISPLSLLEYLPRASNQRFDQSSRLLSQLLKGVIRGPGEGPWTDADQKYLERISPGSWRTDASNETAFRDIKTLLEEYEPTPAAKGRKATVKRVR